MKKPTNINTSTIKRKFPEWAKIDRVINGVSIYNMNIFDNVMTFNQDNLDGEAFDYFGTVITYRELPALRDAYARALKLAGVKEGDVVTLCMPVSIENLMLLFACNFIALPLSSEITATRSTTSMKSDLFTVKKLTSVEGITLL